jgi:hypothetical protein
MWVMPRVEERYLIKKIGQHESYNQMTDLFAVSDCGAQRLFHQDMMGSRVIDDIHKDFIVGHVWS